jgi:hypothetical protein
VQDLENNIEEPAYSIPLETVIDFVRQQTGRPDILDGDDIFADLNCTGKKMTQLVEAFSKRFNVDTTAYRWYFHTNEEDHSIGGMFFKPPYERVQRIPITPEMLWHMANAGQWNIDYPDHEIPSSRVDYLINILLFIGGAILLAYITRHW